MRRLSTLLALVILVSTLSIPAAAKPLSGAARPAATGQAQIREPDLLVPPKAVPATPSADAADLNGNGIADALESRLSSASASERVNVIVRFASAAHANAARLRLGALGFRRHFNLLA